MNWSDLIFAILLTIITGLVGWAFAIFKSWLASKIKDEKLKKIIFDIDEIVEKNVKIIYQTYVESLKDQDKFDKEKQKIALERCKNLIITDFSEDMKNYIKDNYGEITQWVIDKIETTIYNLKK